MLSKNILDLIPHRPPMLLVDKILSIQTDQVVCLKTFTADEYFFQGHYPDNPLVPGVILCECAAQASAILLASEHVGSGEVTVNQVPVLTRMNKVRFKKTVHPGDVIEITASLQETVAGAYFLTAVIRMQGKVVASLELACTLAPAPRASAHAAHSSPPQPKAASRRNASSMPPT